MCESKVSSYHGGGGEVFFWKVTGVSLIILWFAMFMILRFGAMNKAIRR